MTIGPPRIEEHKQDSGGPLRLVSTNFVEMSLLAKEVRNEGKHEGCGREKGDGASEKPVPPLRAR